ncbi:alcohol dehydrogenase [Mycobacterium sp. MFM001]|uniref:zinc-dependent alcohol dehydrogenase n=1 Tax=Mycobacterium sp. MFM001 TaxID=2049453 RepID=UPI000DA481DE|nr:zinc-binding dehydrogenase [Mycobacterium sp. MFM001]GBE66864.1 alcohol dehydrogenase [Mycobacterium sp. MFM001]
MKALVFGVPPVDGYDDALAHSPVALQDIPEPGLLHDDWVITRPRLTGICGSDSKQILLDFGEGDTDNAMAAFCSFPQVMGHEVVADVVRVGPRARGLDVGQRVVLNPWLSCGPRGIDPCPACQAGDYSLCWSFCDGDIKPGIHSGVSADVTGGYAELMPAHDSMLFAVPESVPDELAVFADPFSVSLHAISRHPPPASGRVLVYGAGSLGLCAVAILRALYPDAAVAVVARFAAQAELARRFGADLVLAHEPRLAVVEELVSWGGGRLRHPLQGLPMAHPGAVDVVYDTVGKPETFEVGVRVLRARGTLVKAGVHAPGRWEWSPLYFKEISWVGSNAFGVEEVHGVRKHAIAHYLDMAVDGRIDLRPMLTHTFRLDQWREAFLAIAHQRESGAVKVAFDQR